MKLCQTSTVVESTKHPVWNGTACHIPLPFTKGNTLAVDLIHGMDPGKQFGHLWLDLPTFYEHQSKKNGGKASFETTVEYEIFSTIGEGYLGNITLHVAFKAGPKH